MINIFLLLLFSTSGTASYTLGSASSSSWRTLLSQSTRKAFLPIHRGGGGGDTPSSSNRSDRFGATNRLKSTNSRSFLSSSSASASSSTETPTTSGALVITDFITTENLSLLSKRGRVAIEKLIQHDSEYNGAQKHVYADWPEFGIDDEGKVRLCEQIADLDESYPGGLPSYLTKAKKLLKESADGANPFDSYEAFVPEGESLSYEDSPASTMSFETAESIGVEACTNAVFVLVAGGLGERLGYSGIKLSLETELCTGTTYLELYIKYIQALQYNARRLYQRDDITIPLVIMTSGDTDLMTRKLLQQTNYYGIDPTQITIVTQDKVAALKDASAGLALEDADRWTIQTKPHGHGDVHHLLVREGLVDSWENAGKTHVVFIQDTNALVINGVIPSLGVSVSKQFQMNSLCIPRLAGEAAGAITRLEHKTDPDKSLVINVEYNQLDPLLRTQGDGKGDIADPQTGYSPFPGNANNLVLELSAYAKTLRGEDQGVVLEFVNPKYKDNTRTNFKKPTRLECMMQDIPKLYQKELGSAANIGFTSFDRWFTFSPAKNSLEAGQDTVASGGTAPCTMSSAESDLYIQNQRKLQQVGVEVPVTQQNDCIMLAGIPVTPGPRIVLHPSFGITRKEYMEKIKGKVIITQRSSVVLEGHNLFIRNLEVDGALVIRVEPECYVTVDGLKVSNAGWDLEELDPSMGYPEEVRIRGYTMNKKETMEYIISEPGKYVIDATGELRKV